MAEGFLKQIGRRVSRRHRARRAAPRARPAPPVRSSSSSGSSLSWTLSSGSGASPSGPPIRGAVNAQAAARRPLVVELLPECVVERSVQRQRASRLPGVGEDVRSERGRGARQPAARGRRSRRHRRAQHAQARPGTRGRGDVALQPREEQGRSPQRHRRRRHGGDRGAGSGTRLEGNHPQERGLGSRCPGRARLGGEPADAHVRRRPRPPSLERGPAADAPRGGLLTRPDPPRLPRAREPHHRLHALAGRLPFETKDELQELAGEFLRTFPGEKYPYTLEHIHQHLGEPNPEAPKTFEFGLDLILDGIERLRDTP